MSCRWDYQKDMQREYIRNYTRRCRKHKTEYMRSYRAAHPVETLERWRIDSARYRERMGLDAYREYMRKYYERRKSQEEAGEI